jgi:hypothetical protein
MGTARKGKLTAAKRNDSSAEIATIPTQKKTPVNTPNPKLKIA